MGTIGKVLLGLLGLVVVLGLIGSTGSNQVSKKEYTSQRQVEEYSPDSNTSNNGSSSQSSEDSSEYLDQLVADFQGFYSKSLIKSEFLRAMELYGFAKTKYNMRRVANALIVMRKNNDVTEGKLLRCIIDNHSEFESTEDGFKYACAFCATFQ